mgnify:CR=1 FL=1
MKGGGIFLMAWGVLLFIVNIIGLMQLPEYADRQIPMLFMGVGFFFGGIYLINRAKEKKIEEEKRKREKEEWLGHR